MDELVKPSWIDPPSVMAREKQNRRLRSIWKIGAIGLGITLIFSVLSLAIPAIAVLVTSLGVMIYCELLQGRLRRQVTSDIQRDLANVDGYPTRITIYVGEIIYGSDDGFVWSENGQIFFNGERTSFGYSVGQVQKFRRPFVIRGSSHPVQITLTQQVNGLPVRIGYDDLGLMPGDSMNRSLVSEPLRGLVAWFSKAVKQDAGQPMAGPPISRQVEAPRLRFYWERAIASPLVIAATIGLCYFFPSNFWPLIIGVSFIGSLIFVPMFASPRRAVKALLDWRRLEKDR